VRGCVRIVQQGLPLPEELMVVVARRIGVVAEEVDAQQAQMDAGNGEEPALGPPPL